TGRPANGRAGANPAAGARDTGDAALCAAPAPGLCFRSAPPPLPDMRLPPAFPKTTVPDKDRPDAVLIPQQFQPRGKAQGRRPQAASGFLLSSQAFSTPAMRLMAATKACQVLRCARRTFLPSGVRR